MLKDMIRNSFLKDVINFVYGCKSIYEKKFVIPPYSEKRAIIESYSSKYEMSIFVETGTFLGDTVEYFRSKFDFVYSIELSEELAKDATNRFKDSKNVQILQGDSGILLKDLVKNFNSAVLFWLDGHYSSEFFMGDRLIKTARTETETPIIKELETLLNDRFQHVILIDDARLFTGRGDYPKLKEIRKMVESSPYDFNMFVRRDIIHIVPNKP